MPNQSQEVWLCVAAPYCHLFEQSLSCDRGLLGTDSSDVSHSVVVFFFWAVFVLLLADDLEYDLQVCFGVLQGDLIVRGEVVVDVLSFFSYGCLT